MKNIVAIIVIVALAATVSAGQFMKVHTKSGVVNFSVSTIDSVTFVKDTAIFNNGNIYGVSGVNTPPTDSTRFTLSTPLFVTFIRDYHYYNGGHLPGTISLKHADGTLYGPFQTAGALGQGNVANAYWIAYPNVVIKAGSYVVIDSDLSTWSHNTQSGDKGFSFVKGYPVQ